MKSGGWLALAGSLPLLLSGCAGANEILAGADLPPPLFSCAGNEYTYILHHVGDGALALEIAGPTRGNIGTGTWLTDWQDQRIGYVTGQDGGHQHHLRLVTDEGSYILYEGNNGKLTDAPGRTYAGVTYWPNAANVGESTLVQCAADGPNGRFVETVQQLRSDANLAPLAEEVADGPFDGWF